MSILRVTIGAVASVFLMSSLAFAAVTTGDDAPDFTGVTAEGKTISLSDYEGEIVVLEWTNHQCPFVVKHYGSGNMQATQQEAVGGDVTWLRIISSAEGKQGHVSGEEALRIAKEQGSKATATILDSSGEIGKLYGAKTTPHIFIINGEGELVYQGAIDSISSPNAADIQKAENYVLSALEALEEGEAIDPDTTQPYGCSVKY